MSRASRLLYHLISPIQHGLRDRNTDLFRCLEVDY
jgi:hypothetical protein